MRHKTTPIVIASLLAAYSATGCAQPAPLTSAPSTGRTPATVTTAAAGVAAMTTSAAAPTDARLTRLRTALEAAERGTFDASQYTDLARDPLWGWIEYAALRRGIDTLDAARAQAFLARYPGKPVAGAFREAWLAATARR